VAVDFKPSEVVLFADAALTGTLGRAELEHAATLIVRACQAKDDRWQPIGAADMGNVIVGDRDRKAEPIHSLMDNPFFRPDFDGLVEKGFAQRVGADRGSPLALTDECIEKLRRWVRPRSGVANGG
jgi:hypothetical protein